MRGFVEVYRRIGDKEVLIESGPNLLVDGAGETIADAMTVSPSLSGVPSASAILDTSNYTIQAISFGKPGELFGADGRIVTAHNPGQSVNGKSRSPYAHSVATCSVNLTHDQASGVSSITHQHLTKSLEDVLPTDTRLQRSSTRTLLEQRCIDQGIETNNFGELVGHNMNVFAISADFATTLDAVKRDAAFRANGEYGGPHNVPQILMGCYAPSSGYVNTSGTLLKLFGHGDSSGSEYTQGITEASGNFNVKGSMDASGHVTLINPEGVGRGIDPRPWDIDDPANGLVVSAEPTFSGTGEITYRVVVSGGDAAVASMFGGIWYAGLWTLDTKRLLREGVTPPFIFGPHNNERRYRLFSKKAFTKDITYHEDDGSDSGLKDLIDNGSLHFIWRLFI